MDRARHIFIILVACLLAREGIIHHPVPIFATFAMLSAQPVTLPAPTALHALSLATIQPIFTT